MTALQVIAEAATCHGGSASAAHALIDAGATAGADVIKFQLIKPSLLYSPHQVVDGLRVPNPVLKQRQLEELPPGVWLELAAHCRELQVSLGLTLFDIGALPLAAELQLPFIKIASGDLTYTPLLERVGEVECPVILSTGMSTLGEVEEAIKALRRFGRPEITLLHCVSVYPCPPTLVNLGRLQALKAFGLKIGFSDHTMGSGSAAAAVALGARVLEKHFRLSVGPTTADYGHSLDELAFASYVQVVRDAHSSLELDSLGPSVEELTVLERARRGGYAARDLPVGTVLRDEDIAWLRPVTSLPPGGVTALVGRSLRTGLAAGDPIHETALV